MISARGRERPSDPRERIVTGGDPDWPVCRRPPSFLLRGDFQENNVCQQHVQPRRLRLTMAQAIVKYLQVQFSERDGQTRRLIPAAFGIFGHGNVAGIGQALYEYGEGLPYYQPCNEQSMVHTAIGFAKASQRLATLGLLFLDRTRGNQYGYGSGDCNDQSPAGTAAAFRLLRNTAPRPRLTTVGTSHFCRRECQRLFPSREPLL